jgi:uncharacterized protein YbaP (TraB family)
MKKLRSCWWLLVLVGTGLSAAEVQPKEMATEKHCLWKITGKTNAVYLLGSVHALKNTDYAKDPVIQAAYSNSSTLVFEADIGEMEDPALQLKLLSKGQLPEGHTLETELSPEVYKLFTNRVTEAGLPLFMLQKMTPGLAAAAIEAFELVKMGMDPQMGVDHYFFTRAKEDQKEIIALETAEFQIGLLTGLSKEEGELMMKATLKELDKTRTEFTELVDGWKNGDSGKLERVLNEALEEAPAIYKRLVTDRNETWVPRIENLLKANKATLVVVGAGHLVGKQSVVELLKKKGWKVTQL